jgi:hypothetical protein
MMNEKGDENVQQNYPNQMLPQQQQQYANQNQQFQRDPYDGQNPQYNNYMGNPEGAAPDDD